jgi:BirA family biotin operon repressor/biotin-[acetyl-CoA-carboxylase] ligase
MAEIKKTIDWQAAKNFLGGERALGVAIHSAPMTPSTQIPAKEAARAGAPCGEVFVTDFQNSGRGRRDRGWSAAPGLDLTFSVILRPDIEPRYAQLLNLAAALSVCAVLRETMGEHRGSIGIKWPNDVLAGGKKICGIICETAGSGPRLDYAVLGIGVNVNGTRRDMPATDSPDRPQATSVFIETGRRADLPAMLGKILSELGRFYRMTESEEGRGQLLEAYKKNSSTLGRAVRVITEGNDTRGIATGIMPDGSLAVTDESGTVSAFHSADVVHARLC